MNNVAFALDSLKQMKAPKTCQNLLKNWCNKKSGAECKNIVHPNFQQHRMLHLTATQLQVHKEISQTTATDVKQFRDLAKNGPSLRDFISPETEVTSPISAPSIPYISNIDGRDQKGETYCKRAL